MTYKIAFFSSDWLFEIAQEKQNAINQFLMIIKIYPLICLKSLEITVLFTLWIAY